MFITKKHLSRRTFLRGAGVTIAIAISRIHGARPDASDENCGFGRTRFTSVYVPHGATMYKWTPATDGQGIRNVGNPESRWKNIAIG